MYSRLPVGCRGLLITLEYPQAEKAGPPFSVDQAEVDELFRAHWRTELLEHRDILDAEPSFRTEGVTALSTVSLGSDSTVCPTLAVNVNVATALTLPCIANPTACAIWRANWRRDAGLSLPASDGGG